MLPLGQQFGSPRSVDSSAVGWKALLAEAVRGWGKVVELVLCWQTLPLYLCQVVLLLRLAHPLPPVLSLGDLQLCPLEDFTLCPK